MPRRKIHAVGRWCRFVRGVAPVLSSILLLGSPARGDVPPSKTPMPQASSSPIVGVYRLGEFGGDLVVHSMKGDIYQLSCDQGWEGVGILDGSVYRGVFKYSATAGAMSGRMGVHTIDWSAVESPMLYATYVGAGAPIQEKWTRRSGTPPPMDPDRPRFGDYVHVEEMPEAISKIQPGYPEEARKAGVQGQVTVQALVLADGTVGDTRIVKSVPELDAAAVAAVRQWRFKPAHSKGKPIAVWVAVPVRFMAH